MNNRRTRKKRSRFPAKRMLALAALCLLAHQLGAEQAIAGAVHGLAGLDIPAALAAFQMGAFPGLTTPEHQIGTVGQTEVDETQPLPAEMTDEAQTDSAEPLVSESWFDIPSEVQQAEETEKAPTKTADGNAIRELTIKASGDGYASYQKVSVKNESGLSFSLSSLMKNPTKITKNKDAKEPTVLILHTHASEAYVDQKGARSEDTAHNVVAVGDVMTEELENAGIGVIHCRTIIDKPSYNRSYNRACEIIEQTLEEYPSIKVVLDVHRDSMIRSDGSEYKVVSEVNGTKCAQLMLVMGTNAGGLDHPNWKKNLSFA
ncbi:MAG: stage II sporulation protein P, partial [Butyricicoccaceae bacterium]